MDEESVDLLRRGAFGDRLRDFGRAAYDFAEQVGIVAVVVRCPSLELLVELPCRSVGRADDGRDSCENRDVGGITTQRPGLCA